MAALLGLAPMCAIAGCAANDAGAPMTPTPSVSVSGQSAPGTPGAPGTRSRTPTGQTRQTAPAATSWQPSPFDIQPDVKRRAAQLIAAIGTWGPGQQGLAAARTRVASLGIDPQLVTADNPFLGPAETAIAHVSFAQYGGLLSESASVLVLADQSRTDARGVRTDSGTTFDVRLDAASPRWQVTAVHPATPQTTVATLGVQAKAALANPRLSLPFAAIADIKSGTVSETALAALNRLTVDHTLSVSILESGHPLDVFGTDRASDHPRGRAIDIWQIDDRPVVNPASYGAVAELMQAGVDLGAYQAGGPVQLTPTSAFFSDDTHHDHVHLGFAN